MSNLMEQYVHYHNSLQEINRRAKEEPAAFAEESESVYRAELMRIAEKAARETGDCRIVLLAGPSASGKTTTASLLLDCLRRSGVSSYVFSLDNFYLSEEESPRHADGTPDLDAVHASFFDGNPAEMAHTFGHDSPVLVFGQKPVTNFCTQVCCIGIMKTYQSAHFLFLFNDINEVPTGTRNSEHGAQKCFFFFRSQKCDEREPFLQVLAVQMNGIVYFL